MFISSNDNISTIQKEVPANLLDGGVDLQHVYSPFFTADFNYCTQMGAAAQVVNHVRLIWRGTAVSLWKQQDVHCESLMPPHRPAGRTETTYGNSDSLVQTRSGSVHSPPAHVMRPLPLVLLYPDSQARVTEAPSGKELLRSASLLSIISSGKTGLTQSAAGKNGGGKTLFTKQVKMKRR